MHTVKLKTIFSLLTITGTCLLGFTLYNSFIRSKQPQIIVENHTNKILRVANFQYTSLTEEATGEDEYYRKEIYRIEALGSETYGIRDENMKKNPNYLMLSYYSTSDGIYPEYGNKTQVEPSENFKNGGRIFFASIPKKPNTQAYCRFKVDIYEDRKRIVKPLPNDYLCDKPLYYYEAKD